MAVPSPPRAPVRGGPAHRAVLVAFCAMGAAVGSWGARVPDVRDDLDLAEGSLGAALLGLSIGAVLGSWLGGLLVRRFGSRRVVVVGWIALAGTLAPPGLAGSWGELTLAVAAFGLALGVLDVSVNGAGVQLESTSGEPLLSGLHAGWSGGVLVGAGVGAAAVALDVGPAAHLAGMAVAVAALGIAVGRQVPDGRITTVTEEVHADEEVAEARRRGRARRLAALAGIGGAVFLAEGALLDWSGVLVREDLDGGPLLGAVAVTGFSAGGLLGRLAGDRLAARWGPDRLIRAGVALSTVAFAATLASPWPQPVPVLLLLVGAGLAPSVPLAFAAAGRSFGEQGIATVTTAGYGAYLAGPAVIGGLAHVTALRAALVLPLVLVAAVATLAWSTRPPMRSHGPERLTGHGSHHR